MTVKGGERFAWGVNCFLSDFVRQDLLKRHAVTQ